MIHWHALTTEEVFKKLVTSEDGISMEEAQKRLKKYGPNKLPEAKRFTRLEIFSRQFKSPLIYLLVIASGVSFFLHDAINAYIILAAVVLSVVFGYLQEQKAEGTLAKLEKMVRYKTRIIRGGAETELSAAELVPGDFVLIASGDKVPADLRLVSARNLEIQEAALTGESMPVFKNSKSLLAGTVLNERANIAFMGTVVAKGRASGVVVATGLETEFGKIAESVATISEEKTPFQTKIAYLARWISLIILGVVFLTFIGGLWRGIAFTEMFAASVAVAVAAIPESLVIAVTAILAIGMMRLLRKKALVRKLASAETLGSTTVICADKTGTLTEGEMKVAEVYVENGAETRELALEIGMIANEGFIENPREDVSKWHIHGDPTEKALIKAGIEAGLAEKLLASEEQILDEMPFESQNQFMATLLKGHGNVIYYKGAPEKILAASIYIHDPGARDMNTKLYAAHFKKLEKIYEDFSKNGLRVLAVAYRNIDPINFLSEISAVLSNLTFVGFIALHDPIRLNVKETIQEAHGAGIKVVMVTGDNKYTASSVAKELGLLDHEKIIEGRELTAMDYETLKRQVKNISVYARILPHDKLRIIEAFQANGEVVAMTGDGVNDAPALKKADIGVAMGSGTDVAKETSDMIILDNNFKSIVHAVEQGRVIFDNLKKVVTYLLADSFTEVILIAGSIIAGLPLPVLAGQILWVNLVLDGLPSFALAYEPKEKDVMKLPPTGRQAPILDRAMKAIIFIVGIVSDLILLGLFLFLLHKTQDINYVRTVVFSALGMNSLLYIFSIKSLRRSIFSVDLLNNLYLIAAVLFGFAMLFAAIYLPFLQNILRTVPLSGSDLAIIFALGALEIISIEIAKKVFMIKRKHG